MTVKGNELEGTVLALDDATSFVLAFFLVRPDEFVRRRVFFSFFSGVYCFSFSGFTGSGVLDGLVLDAVFGVGSGVLDRFESIDLPFVSAGSGVLDRFAWEDFPLVSVGSGVLDRFASVDFALFSTGSGVLDRFVLVSGSVLDAGSGVLDRFVASADFGFALVGGRLRMYVRAVGIE